MIERVLGPETRAALDRLSSWVAAKQFYLAGGTGCALHLGHRMSHDLDFFTARDVSPSDLWAELRRLGDGVPDYTSQGTWVGNFERTKVGFFQYPYPLIAKSVSFGDVSVASLEDIGCMKIEAIAGRGRKRDFVDLHHILKVMGFDLETLLAFFRRKYAGERQNLVHVLKSMAYFADADEDPDPIMLVEYSWPEIKRTLIERVQAISI
jgi:hypothetical protein